MPDVSVGSTTAYLAVPVTPGPWPGVVAIHEAFGLNDGIRAHADRLAALGYLALAPDLLVTAAYGQILSAELLGIPRLGGINLHGSILPAYRGAAPVARQPGQVV